MKILGNNWRGERVEYTVAELISDVEIAQALGQLTQVLFTKGLLTVDDLRTVCGGSFPYGVTVEE